MMLGPSNTAGRVDSAFMVIVAACVVLLAIVTVCMVIFLVRYNRKRHPHPEHVHENMLLEVVWTVVPTMLSTTEPPSTVIWVERPAWPAIETPV